MKLSFF